MGAGFGCSDTNLFKFSFTPGNVVAKCLQVFFTATLLSTTPFAAFTVAFQLALVGGIRGGQRGLSLFNCLIHDFFSG